MTKKVTNPRKRAENTRMAPNRQNFNYLAHAQRCPSAAMKTTSSGNMSMISLVAETEHGSVGDEVSVISFS